MKWDLEILLFLALEHGLVAASVDRDSEAWTDFKLEYGKHYKTPEDEHYRKHIFFDNKRKIEEHNVLYEEGRSNFKMGINALSDMEPDEYPHRGLRPRGAEEVWNKLGKTPVQFSYTGAKLPAYVDWREQGIVSPVKNQYDELLRGCQSCYSFAATDAIESQYAIRFGRNILLSQQQIVDCSAEEGNYGCFGGMVDWAYQYAIRAGGLMLESDYPYKNKKSKCEFNSSKIAATITNYGEVKNRSEISLQEAVAFYGPISASIDARGYTWNNYRKGVFESKHCSGPAEVSHGVLIVGYGTEDGNDYWLIKNSYGKSYGDHGYIKMARNKKNMCEIASYANFPIMGEWKPFSEPKNCGKCKCKCKP